MVEKGLGGTKNRERGKTEDRVYGRGRGRINREKEW